MSGVNKAILIGNLGRDPEIRHTQAGKPVCNFTLATNETWKDASGEKQERTEWHNIVVWDKLAEACAQYLSKGSQAYIEGRITSNEWEDKDGIKRYKTEIVALQVQFIGAKQDSNTNNHNQGGDEYDQTPPPSQEDIPF